MANHVISKKSAVNHLEMKHANAYSFENKLPVLSNHALKYSLMDHK